jgi:hypothetical protein
MSRAHMPTHAAAAGEGRRSAPSRPLARKEREER